MILSIVDSLSFNWNHSLPEQFGNKKALTSWSRAKCTYLYEYFKMPDAEANRSLFWLFHQVKREFFCRLSDLDVPMELVMDALKSILVPGPFVRIGRVVKLGSLADRERWERFLHHLMPKNRRQEMRIPRVRPRVTPMITRLVWRTILQFLLIVKQWNHLAED